MTYISARTSAEWPSTVLPQLRVSHRARRRHRRPRTRQRRRPRLCQRNHRRSREFSGLISDRLEVETNKRNFDFNISLYEQLPNQAISKSDAANRAPATLAASVTGNCCSPIAAPCWTWKLAAPPASTCSRQLVGGSG